MQSFPDRPTLDDFKKLAEQVGFQYLEKSAKPLLAPALWKCPVGHRFETGFLTMFYQPRCPKCVSAETAKEKSIRETDFEQFISSMVEEDVENEDDLKPFPNIWPTVKEDYFRIATNHNLIFVGPMPASIKDETRWQCKVIGHVFSMSYSRLKGGKGCPKCIATAKSAAKPIVNTTVSDPVYKIINGSKTSLPQREICELLNATLNYRVGRYCLDCAFVEHKIDIEVDCYHWHKDRIEKDAERDAFLIEQGWRVLRIKFSTKLPTLDEIEQALSILDTEQYAEIVMPDWAIAAEKHKTDFSEI